MFALIGALCFLLALIWADPPFSLITLGWLFVAVQLAFGVGLWPFAGAPWRRP